MPKKIKTRTTSSAARKRINAGKNGPRSGRKGGERTESSAPKIIANSIFALTLPVQTGLIVQQKLKGNVSFDGEHDYKKMYADLLAAYQRGMKLKGFETKVDPLKSGLSLETSLAFVVNGFRNNILEAGWEMRIDKDGDYYYFTMYTPCDLPEMWHVFEVMPIAEYLSKKNIPLLKVYLSFIKYLSGRLGISTWYNGAYGYSDWALEEKLDLWESEFGSLNLADAEDEEQEKEIQENIENYEETLDDFNSHEAGLVKEYQLMISESDSNPDNIRRFLKHTRSKEPIVKFMREAMEFMEEPGCLNDFQCIELQQDDEFEGLTLDRQFSIVWDWLDSFSRMEGECLDADVNGVGIVPPILYQYVTKHTKTLDMGKLHELLRWPMRLNNLWDKYSDVAKDYRIKLKKPLSHESDY